jgi:16S rRNA (guanine527-N7)-methyltransferase
VPASTEMSAAVSRVVGTGRDMLARYADLLAGPGVERGLLGPRETPRLWDRHILNCAVVAPLIAPASVVDDVGSGAGLPGMVLALVRPDLEVTLVEPLLRRATFLTEVVADLGISNVQVERARAEDLSPLVAAGRRRRADVVTARAVAPLSKLAVWCLPLLRDGGELLALKGESAADEVAEARTNLALAGARSVDVVTVGAGVVEPPTTVVRVVGGRPPSRRPREAR